MAKVVKLKHYSDAAHGWVAVKHQTLRELNIADKITPYSYMKGATVYLEEDCDYHTLVTALKASNIPYAVEEMPQSRGQHSIRYYHRYMAW